ncbi:hypothetical protein ABPG75_009825 [Micractinium tetrahymenae]
MAAVRSRRGGSRLLPAALAAVAVFLVMRFTSSTQCQLEHATAVGGGSRSSAWPLGSSWFPGSQPLPSMTQRCGDKVDEERFKAYTAYHPSIHGWMADQHPGVLKALTELQHEKCIVGSVGEIGTHHGRFFFALAATAAPDEKLLAIDLYEDQGKNIDASGGTDTSKRTEFKKHAHALGWPEGAITILSADSTTLTPANYTTHGFPAFRLFSVDGGHAYETTLSDMELAARIMHKGGIVIVDDFVNNAWLGVLDGVVTFTRTTKTGYVPFLWTCTKIYFCHRSHHEMYLDFVRTKYDCTSSSSLRPPSYSIGGVQLCVVDPKQCTWSGLQ